MIAKIVATQSILKITLVSPAPVQLLAVRTLYTKSLENITFSRLSDVGGDKRDRTV